MIYTARELNLLCKYETLIAEDGDAKFVCSKCLGEGYIEEMGGSDADEWGVVDECRCPDCNED